ncbi:MAG: GWxTD domain-containing protein [Bacteroidetes bacterium]|nr:GWxTD domain-containing protein [Bacteroidota bacterium]
MLRKLTWSGLLCVGLLLAGIVHEAQAQASEAPPEFEVSAVSVRGDAPEGLTRVDIYTKVPYARLQFLNTANGFTATYEVTAEVFALDDQGRPEGLTTTSIWESRVVVGTFVATQSDQFFDRTLHSIDLAPGRYTLQVKLEDQDTNEAFVREVPIRVRDLSGAVAISDLMLLDEYDEATNTISPSVDSRVGTDQFGLNIFYEVYADRPRTVQVTREVLNMDRVSGLLPGNEATVGRVAEGPPVHRVTEETDLQAGTNQTIVELAIEDFEVGDYLVRVRVDDASGRTLAQAEHVVAATWTGLAEHVSNLDEAVNQLQYIAKRRELRRIKDANNHAERLQRFQEFWQRRDPTPGTQRNERMEEYYYRVAYANEEYGSLTDGWRTDRGQVLVLFGEPDFVERHPYNFNAKPYQVWYYYRIGKQFIFVDENGVGNYELLIPIWDERNRIR